MRPTASSVKCQLFILLLLAPVLLALQAGATVSAADQTQQPYSQGSWALGMVVPENSQLANGERLSWGKVANITALVQLPNISYSDEPTLAVESVMADDGSILQIATGIYPNFTSWLVYGWYIKDFRAFPQRYDWVLNASKPEMLAGDRVSLSLYLSSGRWYFRVENLRTLEAVQGEFAFNVSPVLKVGDQEVFALESYSKNNLVFQHMGELILDTLNVNDVRVSEGWYAHGGWDPPHEPLFEVGGLPPPYFISIEKSEGGTLRWTYQEWTVSEGEPSITSDLAPLLILPVVVLVAVFASVVGLNAIRKRNLR